MKLVERFWSELSGAGIGDKLLYTLVAVVALMLVGRLLSAVLQRGRAVKVQYRIRKIVGYSTSVVTILLVGRIWFVGFSSLTTYLGLLSAGLAIAMQTPLVNMAGWGFIMWRRPFNVGDRVEIAGHRGDVIDQRVFMFTLMEVGNWVDADQSTGRVMHVPNGKIFTEVLANYSQGFHHIWNEVPVLITFESDWRKAKRILQEIAGHHGTRLSSTAEQRVREAAKKFMIFYSTLTPAVYTTVRDSGVLLTVRLLCDPRQRRNTEQAIWEDILDAFAREPDIDFAYPTQRFYANDREGKPATRPEAVFPPGGGGETTSAP
jgi:small-conductance mechanosensitive channel